MKFNCLKFTWVFLAFFMLGTPSLQAQFLRDIGDPGSDDGGATIIQSPNGDVYIGGHLGDLAMIAQINPTSGSVIWMRTYDPTDKADKIYDLMWDNGDIVACGAGGNLTSSSDDDAFVFKIDATTKNVLWDFVNTSTRQTRLYSINVKDDGTNDYILTGTDAVASVRSNGLILVIDDVSGALQVENVFEESGSLDASDDYSSAVVTGNSLFTVGRTMNGGNALSNSRVFIAEHDFTPAAVNEQAYFASSTATARYYGSDIILGNGGLVFAASGDPASASTAYQIYVGNVNPTTLALTGNAINLNIGNTSEVVRELELLGTDYILYGVQGSSSRTLFMARVTSTGTVTWATGIGDATEDYHTRANTNSQMIVDSANNRAYFIGQKDESSGATNQDIVVGMINLNGDMGTSVSCTDALTVSSSTASGSFNFNWSDPGLTYAQSADSAAVATPTPVLGAPCGSSPPDTCDVNAEFTVQFTTDCKYQFTDISYAGSGTTIVGWLWTFPDGTSSTEQNPMRYLDLNNLPSQEVCLTVTGFDGMECCYSTYCFKLDVEECELEPCVLDPEIRYDFCADDCTYDFSGYMLLANRNISGWYWTIDGVDYFGQNVQVTFASPGSKQVCLTVFGLGPNGECCYETECITIDVDCGSGAGKAAPLNSGQDLGVEYEEQPADHTLEVTPDDAATVIQVFPNPTDGKLTIQNMEPFSTVNVRDMTGKVVVSPFKVRNTNVELDMNDLPKGLYLIQMKSGNRVETATVSVN